VEAYLNGLAAILLVLVGFRRRPVKQHRHNGHPSGTLDAR